MPRFEERGLPERTRVILVVEDNDINREVLCGLLEDEYDILEAADGREGIEQLKKHYEDISLILLDIFMPVLDGFEFLRFRREDDRYSAIPVIVATSSESPEDEIECLRLGANDFVRKPYDPEVIRNRINNTIMFRESTSIVSQLRWDPITGLYNGEFFFRRVDNLFEAYPDESFDMVCSDIHNFRRINERYGHEQCDKLLHDLADELSKVIPNIVASCRIEGDTFAFLIDHQDADWTDALDGAVRSMGISHLYIRFGVIERIDHALSAQEAYDRALMALGQLPESVGASVARYDDALRQQKEIEHIIIETMAAALEERQFVVYYQPKHDLRTDKVAGAEALARWLHPELGLVQPDVFISVFERNGMITQLDQYVCDEACREIARLKEQGLPVVPISVNMSPLDFDDPDLPKRVLEIADRYGIEHDMLHLELTETAYIEESDSVIGVLEELRSYGFKIELDDFGSGYSSLALLNVLPIDILKIDGGMVRNATKMDDFLIIQSAVQIAHLLGMETVIEGVETASAINRLKHLECDLIQGFYYSWPLRQRDFEDYLADNT